MLTEVFPAQEKVRVTDAILETRFFSSLYARKILLLRGTSTKWRGSLYAHRLATTRREFGAVSLHRKMLFACQRRFRLRSFRCASERGETKSRTLHSRGDGMTLQAKFNVLAAVLSFGFVIAVVIGMI
jgi:hypothetical protein